MNDHRDLLDRSAESVANASGRDTFRIRGILSKRLEATIGRLPPDQVAADLAFAGSILLTELSDASQHAGADRALELCERTDIGRLFLRHVYVQDWSRSDPLLYTAPELAVRLVELQKHLIRNREPLLAKGYPVITTAEAYCLLSSPWWHRFGMLYPTKIPVGQSGSIDSSKTTRSSFVWSPRPGKRFRTLEDAGAGQAAGTMPAVNPEETCDYDAAPPMEGMSPEDAARLVVLRPKVLELETQVLDALERVLTDGKGKDAWEACVPVLTGVGTSEGLRLSCHDIDFLLRMDRFYACKDEWSNSSAGTIVATMPGAISLIILLICFCEWTATSGVTQRIREILGAAGLIDEKPLRPPRLTIRSQYQIAGTPEEGALDKAIGLHRAAAKEADDFFEVFFRRVSRLLEHEVRVPVGIEMWVPRGAEKEARGVLQVFASAQESHLEQFGHPMPLSLGGGTSPLSEDEVRSADRSSAGGGTRIFRRAPHGTWSFQFAGKSVSTDQDLKGLSTIAYLLRNADTDCTVMDLAAISAGGAPAAGTRPRGMNEAVLSAEGLSIVSFGDLGDILDPRARSEYRERRLAVLGKLDQAERDGDLGRIPELKREKAALESEMARAIGFGGRRRKVGDPLEKARKTVGKQINVGLAFIKERHPELYVHLHTRLDYDHYVWVYRSVPGITWDT